jgi:hypothetical protein
LNEVKKKEKERKNSRWEKEVFSSPLLLFLLFFPPVFEIKMTS